MATGGGPSTTAGEDDEAAKRARFAAYRQRLRWVFAYHEAGHAIANHRCGSRVDRVYIDLDAGNGRGGACQAENPSFDELDRSHARQVLNWYLPDDYSGIDAWKARTTERPALLEQLDQETVAWLEEPMMRTLVAAVAHALHERGALDAEAFLAIVRVARQSLDSSEDEIA